MAELRYRIALRLANGDDPLGGKSIDERLTEVDVPETKEFSRKMKESYRNRTL